MYFIRYAYIGILQIQMNMGDDSIINSKTDNIDFNPLLLSLEMAGDDLNWGYLSSI